MNSCIQRRLRNRPVQALEDYRVSQSGIGWLQSLSMQALDHCRVVLCLHWTTGKPSNAYIDLLWCHPVPALAYCDVIQCLHWPTVMSFNVGIGLLWSLSVSLLALECTSECINWFMWFHSVKSSSSFTYTLKLPALAILSNNIHKFHGHSYSEFVTSVKTTIQLQYHQFFFALQL